MIEKCCGVLSKKKGVRLFAALAFGVIIIGAMTGCGQEEELPAVLVEEEIASHNMNSRISDVDEISEVSRDAAMEEETTTMISMKDGTWEEQPVLYRGEGFSLYVPNNSWTMFVPGSWYAVENEQVRFWVGSYAGLNRGQVERILTGQGYQTDERGLRKQEGDTLYGIQCVETEKDVWTLNSVICSCEAQEDWEEALQEIFATFEVEEGYDVGSAIPKAVMPEGEYLQLFETTYVDETSRAWDLQDPDYAGSYIYDELIISNITDQVFDFAILRRNYETGESETVIPQSTAYINEDGVSATFAGKDYTLTFDFSDSVNPLPVVCTIKLWGIESLEGINFSSDDIPGYDVG